MISTGFPATKPIPILSQQLRISIRNHHFFENINLECNLFINKRSLHSILPENQSSHSPLSATYRRWTPLPAPRTHTSYILSNKRKKTNRLTFVKIKEKGLNLTSCVPGRGMTLEFVPAEHHLVTRIQVPIRLRLARLRYHGFTAGQELLQFPGAGYVIRVHVRVHCADEFDCGTGRGLISEKYK